MQNTISGVCLLVIAGVMNASFSLPMKFVRKWAWENTWLLWTLFALLVLPPAVALGTVPDLIAIYQASAAVVVWVALAGGAWGVAQVLFGLALDRIGITLTFSIVLGLSAAMGGIIPLLRLDSKQISSHALIMTLSGVVLVLGGVALCAVAGRLRDRVDQTSSGTNPQFGAGLMMAIVSGICASMMNVGFAAGVPISHAAAEHGAATTWTTSAVWVPLMAGGAVPNIAYCLYLLTRRKTMRSYTSSTVWPNLPLTFAMAILWFGSSVVYGIATGFLGNLGPAVGWPLFMSLIVIVASLLGVWTGEWKRASKLALRLQFSAVITLVAAVIVLSRAAS